jgi:hypothetical protein
VAINPKINPNPPYLNPLKYIAALLVKVSKAVEVSKGHGLGSTR